MSSNLSCGQLRGVGMADVQPYLTIDPDIGLRSAPPQSGHDSRLAVEFFRANHLDIVPSVWLRCSVGHGDFLSSFLLTKSTSNFGISASGKNNPIDMPRALRGIRISGIVLAIACHRKA